MCVIGISALLSILALAAVRTPVFLGITAGYAFLTIRMDEQTILDFIRNAAKFFISTQQHYQWRGRDGGPAAFVLQGKRGDRP